MRTDQISFTPCAAASKKLSCNVMVNNILSHIFTMYELSCNKKDELGRTQWLKILLFQKYVSKFFRLRKFVAQE